MKIRSLGDEFFHVGVHKNRRTDMTKLIVALCNCTTTPKNLTFYTV